MWKSRGVIANFGITYAVQYRMPMFLPIKLFFRIAFKEIKSRRLTWMMISIDLHGIFNTSWTLKAFNDNVFIIVRVTISSHLCLGFGMASFRVQTKLEPRPSLSLRVPPGMKHWNKFINLLIVILQRKVGLCPLFLTLYSISGIKRFLNQKTDKTLLIFYFGLDG